MWVGEGVGKREFAAMMRLVFLAMPALCMAEELSFTQWLSAGKLATGSRRALQLANAPDCARSISRRPLFSSRRLLSLSLLRAATLLSCVRARARVGMSDCVFPANSAPESCADVQALFEGTYDSQLSRVGCGLDCRSADDVAALQTVFRSLKVCAPMWLSAPAPLSVPLTLRTLSRRWGTNASTWRRAPPPATPRPTAATLALAPTPTR